MGIAVRLARFSAMGLLALAVGGLGGAVLTCFPGGSVPLFWLSNGVCENGATIWQIFAGAALGIGGMLALATALTVEITWEGLDPVSVVLSALAAILLFPALGAFAGWGDAATWVARFVLLLRVAAPVLVGLWLLGLMLSYVRLNRGRR